MLRVSSDTTQDPTFASLQCFSGNRKLNWALSKALAFSEGIHTSRSGECVIAHAPATKRWPCRPASHAHHRPPGDADHVRMTERKVHKQLACNSVLFKQLLAVGLCRPCALKHRCFTSRMVRIGAMQCSCHGLCRPKEDSND